MSLGVIRTNSYGYLIQSAVLERLKLVPPFDAAAAYSLTPARPIQAEHIPYLGVYLLKDGWSPDGDGNHAEPKFVHKLELGFSFLIHNNDFDAAHVMLDGAHWSIMKLFHDEAWHIFDYVDEDVRIESVTGGEWRPTYRNLGNSNETPIAEMEMEMTYTYRSSFEFVPTDLFELMHFKAVYPWPEDPNRQPIIAEWVLPQNAQKRRAAS
jgi:hypothetical protein